MMRKRTLKGRRSRVRGKERTKRGAHTPDMVTRQIMSHKLAKFVPSHKYSPHMVLSVIGVIFRSVSEQKIQYYFCGQSIRICGAVCSGRLKHYECGGDNDLAICSASF